MGLKADISDFFSMLTVDVDEMLYNLTKIFLVVLVIKIIY